MGYLFLNWKHITLEVHLNIHACIYTPHDKMEYEEILHFFLHQNKSNNAFVFDIVNILGIININNIIFKN